MKRLAAASLICSVAHAQQAAPVDWTQYASPPGFTFYFSPSRTQKLEGDAVGTWVMQVNAQPTLVPGTLPATGPKYAQMVSKAKIYCLSGTYSYSYSVLYDYAGQSIWEFNMQGPWPAVPGSAAELLIAAVCHRK